MGNNTSVFEEDFQLRQYMHYSRLVYVVNADTPLPVTHNQVVTVRGSLMTKELLPGVLKTHRGVRFKPSCVTT